MLLLVESKYFWYAIGVKKKTQQHKGVSMDLTPATPNVIGRVQRRSSDGSIAHKII